ncbi:amidohydrolase [Bacteroidales bacterium OttesenSCG-928-A17]|nr:amidohydrolase [Bacteroidales bacterium OttesenSCG-928-A17]
MDTLRISLLQSDIIWENKEKNLEHYGRLIQSLAGETDLVVLPETFSTGFSMNPSSLAETNEEYTIQTVQSWASEYKTAICGSFIATSYSGHYFNRGFFITPERNSFFYNKRHLFRMGEENKQFTAGNQYEIFPYKGWNIRMIICYDLRFPVWTRNRKNEYDLLICPANWPASRAEVWKALLKARALENQCYVCGVNRIGQDINEISHQGDSLLIDYKGKILSEAPLNAESILTSNINKNSLFEFREKFPAWKDSDEFYLEI